jgi:hypothetical protein
MDTKHTPDRDYLGPWQITDAEDDGWIITDAFESSVALVPVRGDARLIAAAPDMLALLIELIEIEGPQPGHVEWWRKTIAVIAKATGERP